jgi:hypothetical protein
MALESLAVARLPLTFARHISSLVKIAFWRVYPRQEVPVILEAIDNAIGSALIKLTRI